MDEKRISDFFARNRGAIIGGIIGLIVFLLFWGVGFFGTLILAAFVAIGAYFGSRRENWDRFIHLISNLFQNRE